MRIVKEHRGNLSAAARELGIPRTTLGDNPIVQAVLRETAEQKQRQKLMLLERGKDYEK
ncbi:MAG: helix-turn-helix domain-containing protein [Planctomycetia bacterium]